MGLVDFIKSVARDLSAELRKWLKGSTTLEFGGWKRCVTHVQGVVVFMVFIVIMGAMFWNQASAIKVGSAAGQGDGGGGKPVSYDGWTAQSGSGGASGTATEAQPGTPDSLAIEDKNLVSVQFVLKWTDEPDNDRLHQNQPDELGVSVVSPWGANQTASAKNPQGAEGSVTVSFDVVQTKYDGTNGTGEWEFTVFCKDAGDHMPKRIGVLKWIDSGNAYTLEITWKFFTRPGK
ncbi:MAG: hypothetical protein FJ149_12370 [Euryarchaeota archaeon]|nr:hypothetical protein [Euryarchaeota archaeon]